MVMHLALFLIVGASGATQRRLDTAKRPRWGARSGAGPRVAHWAVAVHGSRDNQELLGKDESLGHCGVTEFANGYQTIPEDCCLDKGSIKDARLSPALAGIPKHGRQFSAVLRSNATLVAERTPLFVAWCKEQCRHKCERCRFVSASLLNRECSWYAACRPEQLVRFEDFHSYAVPSTVPLKSHEACEAALEASRVQTPWLATCRQRTKLDVSRWGNCPDKPQPPLPEVATPLLQWVRAQQRVVLFGDSLMRDWFTLMVCLLIGASPTARVTPMPGPHFGLHGATVLELPEGATLTFVWQRKEFLPVNGSSPPALHTKPCLAVRDAKVLFFNMKGAHQGYAAELRVDMGNLVTWLQGANPAQQRVVVEYAPAHFSGTPYGEYNASFFSALPASRGGATPEQRGRCAPHNPSLEVPPANNWRRSVMREVAAEYDLSLLAVWNVSARSHDDHTQHFGGGLKAGVRTDCRHWCNPGRTLLSWVDAMLWMNVSPLSQGATITRPLLATESSGN